MDAMFYIQASTKQQASYIFSTLSPKPTANCQLTDLQNETVVPSISPISLSLNPGRSIPSPEPGNCVWPRMVLT
jgi:hypothetical protein